MPKPEGQTEKLDDLTAFNRVVEILNAVEDPDDQERVLRAAATFLSIDISTPSPE